MRTFKESYDLFGKGGRGSVVPPVRLQGTVGAAEPPPVDEEGEAYTLKMDQTLKDITDILEASELQWPGKDIERFERWHKRITGLLKKFTYGEEANEKPEDQEVRVGDTWNDRFRHID